MNLIKKFPALESKNFRYFIAGQGISLIGTWMQRIAQQWVIYRMTNSAVSLGMIGVYQFTPMLLFSLFAGSFIGRFNKKNFIILMQILQTIQALILTILIWQNIAKPWHIMIMAGVLGCINAFDMPARQSFFMDLVGKESLHSAVGLNSTIVNIGKIIGPAMGGFFLAKYGEVLCFLFNTLSFLAVIYGLTKIKIENKQVINRNNNILMDSYEGIKYVYKNKDIFRALMALLVVSTIAMNSEVVIPVFAKKILHVGSRGFSLMYSMLGLGSLVGALKNAGRKKAMVGLKSIYIAGTSIGIGLFFLGIFNNFYISLIILFAMGYGMVMFMNFCNTTVQLSSVEGYRVRALSIYTLIFTGTTPLGNYITGHAIELFGVKETLVMMGSLTVMGLMLFQKIFVGVKNESKSTSGSVDI